MPDPSLPEAILAALREAGEPVREAVLFERATGRMDTPPSAGRFLADLEHLATDGRVRVTVDHDLPAHDAAPFEARYWHLIA